MSTIIYMWGRGLTGHTKCWAQDFTIVKYANWDGVVTSQL